MGLGPLNAIYQARFNRYLHNRGIKDTSQQHVWAFLGDGEMDEVGVARRDRRGRPRGARQPHLRDQLQPAAARRPGPRQRQGHPGAGGVLPRRRLERHQGGLGPRVGPAARRRHRRRAGQPDERHAGRRLPDLQGRVRRVRPGALLRPRPAHPQDGRGHDRRRDLEPQARRPRLPQAVRGVQGGHRAHRPADGDPGQDDQGLDARLALRGPQRHAPDEEADPGRPQGVPGPALPRHPGQGAGGQPVPAAVLPPGREVRRDAVHARAPQASSAATCRPGAPSTKSLAIPESKTLRRRQARLGQAEDRHHDGLRPAAQGPDEGQGVRRPLGADHPGRGPHVRHGLAVPDREDLLAARPELHLGRPGAVPVLQGVDQRADPARGHQRGRLGRPASPPPARRTPRTTSR